MQNNKLRILMFAPFCYPPASAEAIVTAKLLLAITNAGWEVDVISQANIIGQIYPYSVDGICEPLSKIVKNINGSKAFNAINKLSYSPVTRAINKIQSLIWVAKAVLFARHLISKKKYDYMFSRVSPQYGHLPALITSKKFHMPWIANWSDPMPPLKAPPPYGYGLSASIPLPLRKYYDAVSRRATWHTFPSERLRNYICSYLPINENKSSVMPHIALALLRTNTRQRQSEFSLCHIGGLGLRKPDNFLEGVKLFLQKIKPDESFFLKFVGLQFDNLIETARKLGIEKIIRLEKSRTYEETLEIASKSSVLVVIEAECEEGIFLPCKFVDYVQTSRPILAVSPAVGTLNDIISSYGGGLAVDCRSPDAVAEAIKTLYFAWKTGILEEKYGSDRLFHLFSEKNVIKQYLRLF